MLEIKDPAIKLFGKTIPVAGDGDGNGFDSPRESNASSNFSGEHDVEEKVCLSFLIDYQRNEDWDFCLVLLIIGIF